MLYLEITSFFSLIALGVGFGYIAGRYRYKHLYYRNYGEEEVSDLLAIFCQNKDAHVLNNVTLRLKDGSTTQIDHILITTKGIFVVETKHFKGWIYGSSKSKTWTQITYGGKYKFQNPIFQNYRHVKAIEKLFDFIEPQYIHNIVVFSGEAEFKNAMPKNVFYMSELINAIEHYSNDVISLNRVQFCVGRLEYTRLEPTIETEIEHQEYLTAKFDSYN